MAKRRYSTPTVERFRQNKAGKYERIGESKPKARPSSQRETTSKATGARPRRAGGSKVRQAAAANPYTAGAVAAYDAIPSPTGGSFGKSLFLLILAAFTLYIIVTGRIKGALAAFQGKGAIHAATAPAGKKVKAK